MVSTFPNNMPDQSTTSAEDHQPDVPCAPTDRKRILIIRPSALGDVCRTVPILCSLRESFPKAQIDWLVQDSFVDAVSAHPAVNKVIPFPRAAFSHFAVNPRILGQLLRWLGDLRRRKYDVVYDCQGLARSGFFTRYTGAPKRVGFRDAREGAFLGYTHRYRVDAVHTVDRMLGLLENDGISISHDMRLYVTDEGEATWVTMRANLGLPDDSPYAVLAPTSRWLSKQWPGDRFKALIPHLFTRGFQHIVIVGSENERSQCGELLGAIKQESHVHDLMGKTTIASLMATIAHSDLIIANDSAPIHMAVGFDRRYLALFGPTDPAKVGPYGGNRWVLRNVKNGNHFHHKDNSIGSTVMERISVEAVKERLDDLLAEKPLSCPQNMPYRQAQAHHEM